MSLRRRDLIRAPALLWLAAALPARAEEGLPEPAFYNVGNIEDAVRKAEQLAAEA